MSKQKQKESLSVMIAKTAMAIAAITGIGTIIFGGGVVIMKYYNSEVNNQIIKPVDQKAENYYDDLKKERDAKLLQSAKILEIQYPLDTGSFNLYF